MYIEFEKKYDLRTSDFDCYGKLLPASILDIFQDIAGAHAEEMGIGFEAMMQKQLIWVLIRVKYEILSEAAMHQPVMVKTWPLTPDRIGFQREYLMIDMNGTPLVKGTSEWVLMHSEKRRLMPVKGAILVDGEYHTKKNFEEKLTKIADFDTASEPYHVLTGFTDCDVNGHINNTKYANYALNAIKPSKDEVIRSFQIDYHHEVKLDTTISLNVKREDSHIYVKGSSDEGEKKFSCRIDV